MKINLRYEKYMQGRKKIDMRQNLRKFMPSNLLDILLSNAITNMLPSIYFAFL